MTRAALLTPAEVEVSMRPVRAATRALRIGVATELEWARICSSIETAALIEDRVLPRGLAEHLQCALAALQAIGRRALAAGTWRAVEIYLQEVEHVDTAVDLHEWQLLQLSAAEASIYARAPADNRIDTVNPTSSGVPALDHAQEALL